MGPKHPIQPIVKDENNIKRFKGNAIVHFLYEWARERGMGLHEIAGMPFSKEDREQFAQLLGYSVSGFSELPYVSDETLDRAGVTV